MLSDADKKTYIESRGSRCPYPDCLSPDIYVRGTKGSDSNWMSNRIRCNKCGKQWDDIHTLDDVVEIDA